MLILYSYPELFGLLTIMRTASRCCVPAAQSAAVPARAHFGRLIGGPHAQLPYIVDDKEPIGDSDAIIAHLIRKYLPTHRRWPAGNAVNLQRYNFHGIGSYEPG